MVGRGAVDRRDGLLLWRFAVVGLMLWVESGLKGYCGGLSNRSVAEGYHGGFAVVAVDFRYGSSSWWRWRVAMVVGVGD